MLEFRRSLPASKEKDVLLTAISGKQVWKNFSIFVLFVLFFLTSIYFVYYVVVTCSYKNSNLDLL